MTILGRKEGAISENVEEQILKYILDLKDKTVVKSNSLGEYLRSNFIYLFLRSI